MRDTIFSCTRWNGHYLLKLRTSWDEMWCFHPVRISWIFFSCVESKYFRLKYLPAWPLKWQIVWIISSSFQPLVLRLVCCTMKHNSSKCITSGDCTTQKNDCFGLLFKLLKPPTVCFHFPDKWPLAVMTICSQLRKVKVLLPWRRPNPPWVLLEGTDKKAILYFRFRTCNCEICKDVKGFCNQVVP